MTQRTTHAERRPPGPASGRAAWSRAIAACTAVAGLAVAATLALSAAPAHAADSAAIQAGSGNVPVGRFQPEYDAFAAGDRRALPKTGGIVFVGSSSIRLWDTLETQFDRFPVVLRRGVGGSTLAECTEHLGQLVLAYAPRTVVVYAGENDLEEGATPEQVRERLATFVAKVRAAQPATHIAYVSIKPSPLRIHLLRRIRTTNALIAAHLATLPDTQFIDVFTPMMGPDGQPRADLYREDRLHLNPVGYALWHRVINAALP